MNTVEMATALINRATNWKEFTLTTDVPEDSRFVGGVPFDVTISEGELRAKVYAVDFNEAVAQLDKWLETCK